MDDYKEKYKQKTSENPFLPAHEVVKEVLRDDICTCVIQPGERLKEVEVAKVFGVSRTTVRRAFETLLAEEWLVHNGKQGVKVTPLSLKQYKDLIELRSWLDSFAGKLAAARRTKKDLSKLNRHVLVPDSADYLEFYRTDVAFHKAIYYASGNDYLISIYEHISFDLSRVKSFIAGGSLTLDDKHRVNEEHAKIYNAIREQDGKAAFICSQKHAKMVLTGTMLCNFEGDG